MQAIRPKQSLGQSLTQTTSIIQVQELLDTGIGCISYLRGLFNEDNFIDHTLVCPKVPAKSSSTTTTTTTTTPGNTNSTVKVKKLERGRSEEADKLLDFIEIGAADAISKSYLERIMLAIYLDPDDPTNLVECYTFSFNYVDQGNGTKVPEMIVQNQLNGMVITDSNQDRASTTNPIKPVKVDDAKRQVQKLIRSLIANTQALDELPRRRFVSVRLYYTDDTPENYEPRFFQPIDAQANPFHITTSQIDELPNVDTLGSISTGFHGVTLTMVSVAPHLQVVYDENITATECLARNQEDASGRPIIWDAEDLMKNGNLDEMGAPKPMIPLGIATRGNEVVSIEEFVEASKTDPELRVMAQEVGLIQVESARKEPQLVLAKAPTVDKRAKVKTNELDNDILRKMLAESGRGFDDSCSQSTQIDPIVSRQLSHRPPVPIFSTTAALSSRQPSVAVPTMAPVLENSEELEKDRSTVTIKQQAIAQGFPSASMQIADSQEMGQETQLINYDPPSSPQEPNTQESISQPPCQISRAASTLQKTLSPLPVQEDAIMASPVRSISRTKSTDDSEVIECECADNRDDDAMIQCDVCFKWKHVVCYGYIDTLDARIPDTFKCYPCRVVRDENDDDAARRAEIDNALIDLSTLCLFRRALAIVYSAGAAVISELATRLNVDNSTANQVKERLSVEKFTSLKSKKRIIVVNESSAQIKLKREVYFNPGAGAELGVTTLLECSEIDAEGEDDDDDDTDFQVNSIRSKSNASSSSGRTTRNSAAVVAAGEEMSRRNTRRRSVEPTTTATTTAKNTNREPLLNRTNTMEEDPIVDPDDDFSMNAPLVTPEQVAATMKLSISKRAKEVVAVAAAKSIMVVEVSPISAATVSAQNVTNGKSIPPYKPSFNKGKAKAVLPMDAFQRASSIRVNQVPSAIGSSSNSFITNTNAMQIDPESFALPPASTAQLRAFPIGASGSGLKRSAVEIEEVVDASRAKQTTTMKRVKKCSEGAGVLEI